MESPVHAGPFESSSDGHLAARFDNARGSRQALLVRLRITHPAAIGFEVVWALASLVAIRGLPRDGVQQSVEPSAVEFLNCAVIPRALPVRRLWSFAG
jgi:hypothetical protein